VKRRASQLVLCAGLLWASRARAAPGDATHLEYARSDRALGCPDETALKGAVVQRLGYDPFFPAARQTIVVEITDEAAGLRARMRLVDEHGIIVGSRELSDRANNCSELVASLALAISIALDPSAALGANPAVDAVAAGAANPKKEAEEAQPASPAAVVPEAPTTPPAPVTAPVSSTRDRRPAKSSKAGGGGAPSPFAVRGALFGALGAAPSTALGGRLGGSVRSEWFYFAFELADQLPASRSAPFGGNVQTSVLDVALLPCAAWHMLAGCALFQAGSLRAKASGVDSPVTAHSLYLAAGVRVEISPELGRHLRLLVNVDALRALTPVTLRLLSGDVWQTPALSGAAGAGLEWQIP
jgi:hypothetical protein